MRARKIVSDLGHIVSVWVVRAMDARGAHAVRKLGMHVRARTRSDGRRTGLLRRLPCRKRING